MGLGSRDGHNGGVGVGAGRGVGTARMGNEVEPIDNSVVDGAQGSARGGPERTNFSKQVAALMASSGIRDVDIAHRMNVNKATVGRWRKGEHLPPADFVEIILNMAEERTGKTLAVGFRDDTHRLYSAAAYADRYHRDVQPRLQQAAREQALLQDKDSLRTQLAFLSDVLLKSLTGFLDLYAQRGHLTAELSQCHYEIEGLRRQVTLLRRGGQPTFELDERLRRQQARAEALRADRQAVAISADQAEHIFLSMVTPSPEEETPEHRMVRARLRAAADSPRQQWWPQPPVVATGPAPVGVAVEVPPFLPPAPSPSSGRLLRGSVAVLAVAVAVLAVAVVVILVRTSATSTVTAGAAAPTVTIDAHPSIAATPSGTSPAQAAAPTGATVAPTAATAAPPDSGRWTAQYRDTAINVPSAARTCGRAIMDLDPARGAVLDPDDFMNIVNPPADLTIQQPCSSLNSVTMVYPHLKAWGTSSAQEPGPDQCRDDAMRQTMPNPAPFSKMTVGSAYCVITAKDSVAWFKVTAKPGSDQQGMTVTATLWTASG
ncbi:hypothetical protein GCM10010502_72980 [Kitasatospora aureofaciens]|uniref:Uncharacterized protein n=2 Tax=Kitasatospora aureofaciens TaxID=1894 RepID=A0A8H9HZP1_KITAU|nr:hypothetical protein GCM10010502_72980 [Kitasatospora aureofaciens]